LNNWDISNVKDKYIVNYCKNFNPNFLPQ